MYLIQIRALPISNEKGYFINSSIERIQSFEIELNVETSGHISCVPYKGGKFDVEYGISSYKSLIGEDYSPVDAIIFCAIADSADLALYTASIAMGFYSSDLFSKELLFGQADNCEVFESNKDLSIIQKLKLNGASGVRLLYCDTDTHNLTEV